MLRGALEISKSTYDTDWAIATKAPSLDSAPRPQTDRFKL